MLSWLSEKMSFWFKFSAWIFSECHSIFTSNRVSCRHGRHCCCCCCHFRSKITPEFPTLLNKYAVQNVQSLGESSSIRTIVTKQRHLIAADWIWFRIIISTLISFDWISNSKQIWMTKKRLNDKNKRETLKEFFVFKLLFTLHYVKLFLLAVFVHFRTHFIECLCVSFFLLFLFRKRMQQRAQKETLIQQLNGSSIAFEHGELRT